MVGQKFVVAECGNESEVEIELGFGIVLVAENNSEREFEDVGVAVVRSFDIFAHKIESECLHLQLAAQVD
jgi:hypothetical protein